MHYWGRCSISEKCFIAGLYDYDGMSFILDFITPDDVFYDIGTNIGPFSILANQQGAKVISFECSPSTCILLRKNLALNKIEHAKVINAAVGNFDGIVNVTDDEGSGKNAIVTEKNNKKSVQVKAITLDSFVSCSNYPEPTYVKMDTEGNEPNVIKGMKRILESGCIKFISFEANGLYSPEMLQQSLETIENAGFMVGRIDYHTKCFLSIPDFRKKSPTGDYHALSSGLMYEMRKKGFRIQK